MFDPAAPVPGEAVRVVVDVSDADGDPVKTSYEWSLRGEPVGNGTAKLMLADAARGDRLAVSVFASDGRADAEPASVSVTLGNQPPTVQRIRMGPALRITAGQPVVIGPEGSDPEGDPLRFDCTWLVDDEPAGAPVEIDAGGTAEFDTASLSTGDTLRAEVVARDGESASEPFRSPLVRVINQPPRVVSRPEGSPDRDGFHYRVVADDPDGDAPLRFELADAPRGMRIGAHSGEVDWLPAADQAGHHAVRVVVDDLRGGRISHAFDVDVGGRSPPASPAGRNQVRERGH
ncbi:MAG: hypothetical protein ACQGVC_14010 [Myxococcota bacterium]